MSNDYQANDTIYGLDQSGGRFGQDEDQQQHTYSQDISQQNSALIDYQEQDINLQEGRSRNETEMTDIQKQQMEEEKQKQDEQQNQQQNQNQYPPQYQTQQRSNQGIAPQQSQAQQYQQQSVVQHTYAPQQQPISQYQQPQNQQYAQNQQSVIQKQAQQSQQPVQYQQQQQPYYQQPIQYQQQQNPYPPQHMAFQQYPAYQNNQQPQIIVQQPQIIKEIVQAPNYPLSANGFRNSIQVQCPFCKAVKYTKTEYVPGSTYWKYTICLIICCPILCWIPWCNEDCYDVKSYCGQCSMEVGVAESHK